VRYRILLAFMDPLVHDQIGLLLREREILIAPVLFVLSKSDEVLVVCVHVSELNVNEQNELVLRLLLILTDPLVHDSLGLLPQMGISLHLE